MIFRRITQKSFFWPLLSGFFIGTSYIPFPPYALFFCYVPLWLFALKTEKLGPLITGSWLCQFMLTLIGFGYLPGTLMEMEFPLYQALVLFLVFCSVANLHIPLSLLLWFFFRKALRTQDFASALSVLFLLPVLLGLSTEYVPMIFDWHLGYMYFYAKWPMAQTAEIWGFRFLNTLTLFSNLIFLWLYLGMAREKPLFLRKCPFFRHHYLNQTGTGQAEPAPRGLPFEKGAVFGLFPSHKANMKHAFSNRISIVLFAGWLLLMVGLNGCGGYLKNRLPETDQKVHVLMIQPNIENHQQDDKESRPLVMSKLLQATSKHFYPQVSSPPSTSKAQTSTLAEGQALKPDFILWPEGAYPYPIHLEAAERGQDLIQKWVRVFDTALVVSARGRHIKTPEPVKTDKADPAEKTYTNSIFVFDKEGGLVQPPYDKGLLTPIGEYTPGARWFPFMDRWLFGEQSKIFKKGTGKYKTAPLSQWRLGFHICYEGLFDHVTRDLVREGADLIVNVANDAYFGRWQEPYQLAYMTLSRAVEMRRPLIRGANSGPSAIVSAKGDILVFKDFGVQSGWEEIPLYSKDNQPSAFFVSYGYYINQVFLWVCLLLILVRRGPAIAQPLRQ